jgi:hypothetical protein
MFCFKYNNYHNSYDNFILICKAIWVDIFIVNYYFQIVGIVHRTLLELGGPKPGPQQINTTQFIIHWMLVTTLQFDFFSNK